MFEYKMEHPLDNIENDLQKKRLSKTTDFSNHISLHLNHEQTLVRNLSPPGFLAFFMCGMDLFGSRADPFRTIF